MEGNNGAEKERNFKIISIRIIHEEGVRIICSLDHDDW